VLNRERIRVFKWAGRSLLIISGLFFVAGAFVGVSLLLQIVGVDRDTARLMTLLLFSVVLLSFEGWVVKSTGAQELSITDAPNVFAALHRAAQRTGRASARLYRIPSEKPLVIAFGFGWHEFRAIGVSNHFFERLSDDEMEALLLQQLCVLNQRFIWPPVALIMEIINAIDFVEHWILRLRIKHDLLPVAILETLVTAALHIAHVRSIDGMHRMVSALADVNATSLLGTPGPLISGIRSLLSLPENKHSDESGVTEGQRTLASAASEAAVHSGTQESDGADENEVWFWFENLNLPLGWELAQKRVQRLDKFERKDRM
jgi:hypothetical protein